MKSKSINTKLKIWIFLYFIFVLIFVIFNYYNKKSEEMNTVKLKLKNATKMAYVIVGDKFLVNAMENPELNSKKLIWEKLKQLTKYNFIHNIKQTGFETTINNNCYDVLVSLENTKKIQNHTMKVLGDPAYCFNESKNVPKTAQIFTEIINSNKQSQYWSKIGATTKIKYMLYSQKIKLSNGKICLVASGINITNIDNEIRIIVFKSLIILLFFLILGLPFIFLLRKKLKTEKTELESTVEERTKELRTEKQKVEQANKSKDQFFANMSHDFRTPLNAIMGFSNQIDSEKSDNKQLSRYIKMSANYMLNFTEDLLDFTKIEKNSLEYAEEIVNLEEVIMMGNECYALKAYEDGKKFTLDLSNNLPLSIESSKRRLFQIINNLVSNSMKFIKKGQEVKLKISVNKENKLEIVVHDNGIGIEKENIGKIFKKFYKANTKNNGSGVGLGLFITKTIVENMNGSIEVESEINKFTKFTMTLPLKEISKDLNFENMYNKYLERNNFKSEARKNKNLKEFIDETLEYLEILKTHIANNDSQSMEAYAHKIAGMSDNAMLFELDYYARKIECESLKPEKDMARIKKYCKILEEGINKLPYPKDITKNLPKNLKNKDILIVDDTLYNSRILHETLYDIGYGSDFVLSGKEALEMIKTKKYKVIFIDINMPEMDGKQLFEKLKQIKIKATMIAFTADKTDETKKSLLELGFDEIFDKRISEGQLTRILEKFLK